MLQEKRREIHSGVSSEARKKSQEFTVMLHSEDDSNGALRRGAGVMRKMCLMSIALLTSLMFFNNINIGETVNPNLTFGVRTAEAADIDVWWPINDAEVSGTQPFKFSLDGRDVTSFDGYWKVGNGSLNKMSDVYRTYPHKEADVSLHNWTWEEDNSYRVTFIAQEKDGTEISRETVEILVLQSETPVKQKGVQKNGEEVLDAAPVLDPEVGDEAGENIGEPFEEIEAAVEDITSSEEKDDVDHAESKNGITVLSPQNNEKLSGVRTLTVVVNGMSSSEVRAYWKVGGGTLNPMQIDLSDETLKANAAVDFQNWTWRSDGKYDLTFVAVSNEGQSFVETVQIEVGTEASVQTPPQESEVLQSEEPAVGVDTELEKVKVPAVLTDNPLAGRDLYLAPNSNAERQANEWRNSRPADAALMDIMAAEPQAMWIGGWGNTEADVRNRVRDADARGEVAVFVAYNIPHRDCGLYSAGGAESGAGYRNWIAGVARGIEGSNSPVVILEPDALAGADCLSETLKAERKQLIREAIVTLKSAGAIVYVEASSPPWKTTEEMARRLQEVGVENAHGFAMNTSSYTRTSLSIQYGEEISRLLGGLHFVVDTSRSGQGQTADFEWCNPSGRGLGERPTTDTGHALVDAFMWVKSPGESDGTCNGGPSAGQWYPEQALELVKNRAF